MTLGADGLRVSADSLLTMLRADRAVQCLFRGTHCGSSKKRSVLDEIGQLDNKQA